MVGRWCGPGSQSLDRLTRSLPVRRPNTMTPPTNNKLAIPTGRDGSGVLENSAKNSESGVTPGIAMKLMVWPGVTLMHSENGPELVPVPSNEVATEPPAKTMGSPSVVRVKVPDVAEIQLTTAGENPGLKVNSSGLHAKLTTCTPDLLGSTRLMDPEPENPSVPLSPCPG